MSDVTQVLGLIESAFPSKPLAGAITRGCACEECKGLDRALSRQRWDDLSDEIVSTEFGSLPLFSGEAFQAFLPAWMTRSLDCLDARNCNIREWTLYALAVYIDSDDSPEESARKKDGVRRRSEYLTSEQAASVRAFLILVQEKSPMSDWERKSINLALDLVWRPPSRPPAGSQP